MRPVTLTSKSQGEESPLIIAQTYENPVQQSNPLQDCYRLLDKNRNWIDRPITQNEFDSCKNAVFSGQKQRKLREQIPLAQTAKALLTQHTASPQVLHHAVAVLTLIGGLHFASQDYNPLEFSTKALETYIDWGNKHNEWDPRLDALLNHSDPKVKKRLARSLKNLGVQHSAVPSKAIVDFFKKAEESSDPEMKKHAATFHSNLSYHNNSCYQQFLVSMIFPEIELAEKAGSLQKKLRSLEEVELELPLKDPNPQVRILTLWQFRKFSRNKMPWGTIKEMAFMDSHPAVRREASRILLKSAPITILIDAFNESGEGTLQLDLLNIFHRRYCLEDAVVPVMNKLATAKYKETKIQLIHFLGDIRAKEASSVLSLLKLREKDPEIITALDLAIYQITAAQIERSRQPHSK